MNGTSELRTGHPRLGHALGIALRFSDVFTGSTIRVPLEVTIPARGLRAVVRSEDAIYRFLFTDRQVPPVPAGNFDVEVIAPGGEYVSFAAIQVTLPVVASTPPQRSDFLQEVPLWPTRRLRPPTGETAVLGRIVRLGPGTVDNLEVRLFEDGQPVPAEPFQRSDRAGEFLFRLPWLRGGMSGTTTTPPPDLAIQIRQPSGPLLGPVTPATFTPEPGRVQVRTFQIP